MVRRGPPAAGGEYKEVRGLVRGIAVLRALNRMPAGIGSITALAEASGLHRTTVKRLLETLRTERLVEHDEGSGLYALTFEVRRLAEGYGTADWIDRIAVPAMFEMLPSLLWPSDIATPEAGWMVVRESTHRGSTLSQHRAMIGTRMPMPVTALGRAYLAWCGDDERRATLDLIASRDDAFGAMARDRRAMERLLAATRRRGWATNEGELLDQADFAAIALPLRSRGRVVAAVNLVFPKNVVPPRDVARRYVPLLRTLVDTIGLRLAAAAPGGSGAGRPEPSLPKERR
jgi:IclR family mhp operon transcriptional activator